MLFAVAVLVLAIAVVAGLTTSSSFSTEQVARTLHRAGHNIGGTEMSRQSYQGASALR